MLSANEGADPVSRPCSLAYARFLRAKAGVGWGTDSMARRKGCRNHSLVAVVKDEMVGVAGVGNRVGQ